ncbi:UNVERIFIED_CONTAM: hypothetical protein FKN15_037033 [Acipenser sinensis]
MENNKAPMLPGIVVAALATPAVVVLAEEMLVAARRTPDAQLEMAPQSWVLKTAPPLSAGDGFTGHLRE